MDIKILKTTDGTEIHFIELEEDEMMFIEEIKAEWDNYITKT